MAISNVAPKNLKKKIVLLIFLLNIWIQRKPDPKNLQVVDYNQNIWF